MIILLILLAMLLIFINFKAALMEKSSFKQVLNNNFESSPQDRLEIIELRRELGETVADLQKEMLELKTLIEQRSHNTITEEENISSVLEQSESKEIGIINDKVIYMLKQGASIEEICSSLGMGKGEVLLIKNLYLRENN